MSAHVLWFRRTARQLQVLGTKFELDCLPQVQDLVKTRMGGCLSPDEPSGFGYE
jgi:hypothetical protein